MKIAEKLYTQGWVCEFWTGSILGHLHTVACFIGKTHRNVLSWSNYVLNVLISSSALSIWTLEAPQSCDYFCTWKCAIWQRGIFQDQFTKRCHISKVSCLRSAKMICCDCVFVSSQVYQLPPYWDKLLPCQPGSRPPGGDADTKSELGDVRSTGARAARGSQPTTGQELWRSPSPHTPH